MTLPFGFFGANVGPTELLLVLGIILVLFGGKKLPELAHSLGRSLGEFKKGTAEGEKLAYEKVEEMVGDGKKDEPKKIDSPKA